MLLSYRRKPVSRLPTTASESSPARLGASPDYNSGFSAASTSESVAKPSNLAVTVPPPSMTKVHSMLGSDHSVTAGRYARPVQVALVSRGGCRRSPRGRSSLGPCTGPSAPSTPPPAARRPRWCRMPGWRRRRPWASRCLSQPPVSSGKGPRPGASPSTARPGSPRRPASW